MQRCDYCDCLLPGPYWSNAAVGDQMCERCALSNDRGRKEATIIMLSMLLMLLFGQDACDTVQDHAGGATPPHTARIDAAGIGNDGQRPLSGMMPVSGSQTDSVSGGLNPKGHPGDLGRSRPVFWAVP